MMRMTNLPVWMIFIIAITPAVITMINSWALKWFEIRQNRAAPKKEPDATSELHEKKTRKIDFLGFVLPCVLVASSIYLLIFTILFPTENHNLDSFFICMDFVIIWSNLNIVFIGRRTDATIEHMAEIIGMHTENFAHQNKINRHILDTQKGAENLAEEQGNKHKSSAQTEPPI
jgi:hypothetical protein